MRILSVLDFYSVLDAYVILNHMKQSHSNELNCGAIYLNSSVLVSSELRSVFNLRERGSVHKRFICSF